MGQFALEIAAYSLDFFEKFFDQKFPLPIPVLSLVSPILSQAMVGYDFVTRGLYSLPNAYSSLQHAEPILMVAFKHEGQRLRTCWRLDVLWLFQLGFHVSHWSILLAHCTYHA